MRPSVPGRKFSTRTSARSISVSSTRRPSGCFRLRVRLSLLRLMLMKYALSPSWNGGPQPPGIVALARLLHLDDAGPHVGEHHRAVGAGEHAGQVENGQPVEGAGRSGCLLLSGHHYRVPGMERHQAPAGDGEAASGRSASTRSSRDSPSRRDAAATAVPDPQPAVEAEVVAGNDQHAFGLPEPVGERGRSDIVAVANEPYRPGSGGTHASSPACAPSQAPTIGKLAASIRRVRSSRAVRRGGARAWRAEPVAERTRCNRRVVAAAPEVGRHVPRGDRPADAQAGQAVGLRQPAGHDYPLGAAPRARRLDAIVLAPPVDLVGQHPGAVPVGDLADPGHLRLRQPRPRRVVRIADGDEPGAIRHQRPQLVEIGRPAGSRAAPLRTQRPGPDDGAEPFRQAVRLPVVRMHHHDFVAGLDQPPAGYEVGFGAAVGDEHLGVGRRRAGWRRSRRAAPGCRWTACRREAGRAAGPSRPRRAARRRRAVPRRSRSG